jgi:hypothetical protein
VRPQWTILVLTALELIAEAEVQSLVLPQWTIPALELMELIA